MNGRVLPELAFNEGDRLGVANVLHGAIAILPLKAPPLPKGRVKEWLDVGRNRARGFLWRVNVNLKSSMWLVAALRLREPKSKFCHHDVSQQPGCYAHQLDQISEVDIQTRYLHLHSKGIV